MRKIEIKALASDQSATKVFAIISDFEKYQMYSDVVREVNILEANGKYSVSRWEVNFRQGILRWTEKDLFDHEELTIKFDQLHGDADHFSGEWLVSDTTDGCLIKFNAQFDMGIPSLSEIIEPIAEQALNENIQSILSGLLNNKVSFLGK